MTQTGIRMARSKAGHDKGTCYVVVREEPDRIYVADGRSRTVDAPKQKNKKHVQIIEHIPAQILAVFCEKDQPTDPEIRRALELYRKTAETQEEAPCQKQMSSK